MRSVVVLLVLAGCWTSSQSAAPMPPPAPEPVASSSAFRSRPPMNTCQRTIGGMVDKMRSELLKSGIPEATIDEMVEAAIESCRVMEWSPDLLGCYDAIDAPPDIDKCQTLMTREQTEDFTRRMMDIISRMSSQQPPPPPP